MARGIRAIILNTDEDIAVELRSQFLAIDGLKIVAELDEPALFDHAIKQFPADLVIIHLDPNPDELMQAAAQINGSYPDLTLFAVSSSSDPQMILQSMRNGFREFLIRPIDEKQLSEAVGRINKLSSTQAKTGKLICVVGAVGGIGTTTLAANLGCELTQFDKTSAGDCRSGHVFWTCCDDAGPDTTIHHCRLVPDPRFD